MTTLMAPRAAWVAWAEWICKAHQLVVSRLAISQKGPESPAQAGLSFLGDGSVGNSTTRWLVHVLAVSFEAGPVSCVSFYDVTGLQSHQIPSPHQESMSKPGYLIFGSPITDQDAIEAVSKTVASCWLGTGPRVFEFEQAFARYVGAPQAIATASCTAALHLASAVRRLLG